MFPVPNISFEIDTKVVDLFIISLPNSVINLVSFFLDKDSIYQIGKISPFFAQQMCYFFLFFRQLYSLILQCACAS